MTATTSSKPNNYFGVRIRNDIRSNKKLNIVYIVMHVLGLPFAALGCVFVVHADSLYNATDDLIYKKIGTLETMGSTLAIIGAFAFAITLFIGMIYAFSNFDYLNKKHLTDMNYAFPLNSNQRFFADYLSGLLSYFVPTVIAFLVGTAIFGCATPFLKNPNDIWEVYPTLVKLFLIVFSAMIQYYTITVLSITFCGNKFESIFTTLAINIFIPVTIFIAWEGLITDTSFGIAVSSIYSNSFFTSTTPIGAIILFFTALDSADVVDIFGNSTFFFNAMIVKYVVTSLIFSVIYTLLAYVLYRFRKAEDVSKPYVYRSCFYLIMTMCIFCIIFYAMSIKEFVVGSVILSAIIWFIMEVITRRGFKKFWQAVLSFSIAATSVFLVRVLFVSTDGFGIVSRVPSASSVESVTLNITNEYNGTKDKIRFTDKNVIRETIKVHETAIDRYFNYNDYDHGKPLKPYDCNMCSDINTHISYSTYTGTTMERQYYVPSEDLGDLYKAIVLSDEYAEHRAKMLCTYLTTFGSEKYVDIIFTKYDTLENKTINVNDDVIKRLGDAYCLDYKNMTEEDIESPTLYGVFDIGPDFPVFSQFENTIEVINEVGLRNSYDLYTIDQLVIQKDPRFYTSYYTIYAEDQTGIYYDGSNVVSSGISAIDTDRFISYDKAKKIDPSAYGNSEICKEILDRSTPYIFNEMPLAAISLDYGNTLFILDRGDNREFVEKVFESKNLQNIY